MNPCYSIKIRELLHLANLIEYWLKGLRIYKKYYNLINCDMGFRPSM